MSQERESPSSHQAASLSSSASSTASSTSSVQPRPDRRPSSTPVIAGSLVGFIVIIVVFVLLLINKRRQLPTERALRQPHHSDPTPFPPDGHRDKRGALGVFNVPPIPRSQDSPSSSEVSPGVPPIPKPTHDHQHVHYHQPNNHHSRSHSNPSYHHHHHQSQPYQLQSHRGGQSSTSSSSAQSHTPLLSQQQTQNPNTHLIPGIGVPHGHLDAAVDVVADNNNVSINPAVIFGSASRFDADADARNATGEGGRGSNAGVPAIVVTRDGEDIGGESRGGGVRVGRGSAELPLVVGSGNRVDRAGGRDELPMRADGYRLGNEQGGEMDPLDGDRRSGRWRGTSRLRVSASGLDYSYPASGPGNFEGVGGRMADIGRARLSPESAGYGYSGRPRTASGSTSGSSLPSTLVTSSTLSGTVVPPSPTKSAASSTGNLAAQNSLGQNTDVVLDNALLSPSVPPLTRQGQNQAYIGNTPMLSAPPEVEEEAPPAYENVWAVARQEDESLRSERRGEQERTQS